MLSIGLGLGVSVLFSETFGIAAGGMVVPGYLALSLSKPINVLLTLTAALITYVLTRAISSFVIVYGRRRTALTVLIGYLIGIATTWLSPAALGADGEAMRVVGYIIPGLIAIWLDRQGVVETISAGAAAAVIVRLLLVLFVGSELRV
jgi:poly-gamma-glutamate biosynthesis protein PgsC/CapC